MVLRTELELHTQQAGPLPSATASVNTLKSHLSLDLDHGKTAEVFELRLRFRIWQREEGPRQSGYVSLAANASRLKLSASSTSVTLLLGTRINVYSPQRENL